VETLVAGYKSSDGGLASPATQLYRTLRTIRVTEERVGERTRVNSLITVNNTWTETKWILTYYQADTLEQRCPFL
jgi:hypothetical protein